MSISLSHSLTLALNTHTHSHSHTHTHSHTLTHTHTRSREASRCWPSALPAREREKERGREGVRKREGERERERERERGREKSRARQCHLRRGSRSAFAPCAFGFGANTSLRVRVCFVGFGSGYCFSSLVGRFMSWVLWGVFCV